MANAIKTSEESANKSGGINFAVSATEENKKIVDGLKTLASSSGISISQLVLSAIKQYMAGLITCCGITYDNEKKFCHQCGKTLKPAAAKK